MHDFMITNVEPQFRRGLINELTIEQYKFNWSNPTGHWRLNLENRIQRIIMMKLIAINQVESEFSRKNSGRGDTSQEGNWFNFRNAKLVGLFKTSEVLIDQAMCDKLPKNGIIEFDYVSTTRPGAELAAAAVAAQEKAIAANMAAAAAAVAAASASSSVEGQAIGASATTDVTAIAAAAAAAVVAAAATDAEADEAEAEVEESANATATTATEEEFAMFLRKLDLSARNRIPRENVLFPLIELQLAVTKYYFTVYNVLSVMECFSLDWMTQAKVVVTMFSRIKDLYNMVSIHIFTT